MANKQLTATVRLNTTQAEQKLRNIAKAIDALNRAVGKKTNAYNAVNSALTTSVKKTNQVKTATDQWAQSQKQVNNGLKNNNSILSSVGNKLKSLAATYMGIMGTKAVIQTSDTITKAQNKLNNLNGGDANATQEQMDKMYASANKVRMAYTDMLGNASKSMVLAGDAFQGNMDNAIRFQEIMTEAYALGGASNEEMSTSMYQMIQALGAGTLAGDELRSVREGAPLAYKEIEKFAQELYKTDESLKDLAADGLITSEMVVAAIMRSGEAIDEQFENTAMTFENAWDRIKNAAVKAFEPVSNSLRDMLNKAAENGVFEKIEQAFWNLSKALQIAFELISRGVQWTVDNWYWLKYVVGTVLIVIGALLIKTAAIAVWSAIKTATSWLWANKILIVIAIAIMALVWVFQQWKNAAIDTCTAIALGILIIGAAIGIVMILCGNFWGLLVVLIAAILALVVAFFQEVCYGVAWLAAWIVNIGSFIWNVVVWLVQGIASAVAFLFAVIWNIIATIIKIISSAVMFVYTLIQWVVATIVNAVAGCANVIFAFCQNIGIAFQNAWNGALASFWNFIASCMEGLDWLAKPISAIAELFGKSFDYEGFTASLRSKADGYSAKQKDYVSLTDAWVDGSHVMRYDSMGRNLSDGWNVVSYSDSWTSNTWDWFDPAHTGYVDANNWGNTAQNWGAGIEDAINEWGSQFQTGTSSGKGISSTLDDIGKTLGLDFSSMANGFPNAGNGAYDTSKAYNNPGNDKLLNGIKDDTASIDKNLDLSEEDLDYLRRIADMEWKKEYTTANIKIEMTNNNNVNSDYDLESLAIGLRDLVEEEMYAVANGVLTN